MNKVWHIFVALRLSLELNSRLNDKLISLLEKLQASVLLTINPTIIKKKILCLSHLNNTRFKPKHKSNLRKLFNYIYLFADYIIGIK